MFSIKPSRKITAPVLPNGTHHVSIKSITEHGQELSIKFANDYGYFVLYLEIEPKIVDKLSNLMAIAGVEVNSNTTVDVLIGCRYNIVISDNVLSKIKLNGQLPRR